MNIPTTDLTQHPPRSVRARLGGYALLPRLLDKCRADLAGTLGEFKYDCPNDQRILEFLGMDAAALKAEVTKGAGDGDILKWIAANQRNPHTPAEIEAWSTAADQRVPDADSREFFDKYLSECGPQRKDITRWADLLDLDDFVTFGGKA